MFVACFTDIYFELYIERYHWIMQSIFLVIKKSDTMLIKTTVVYCANVIGSLPYLLMTFSTFIRSSFLIFTFSSLILFFQFRIFLFLFFIFLFISDFSFSILIEVLILFRESKAQPTLMN